MFNNDVKTGKKYAVSSEMWGHYM